MTLMVAAPLDLCLPSPMTDTQPNGAEGLLRRAAKTGTTDVLVKWAKAHKAKQNTQKGLHAALSPLGTTSRGQFSMPPTSLLLAAAELADVGSDEVKAEAVGVTEIAIRLKLPSQTVDNWRKRGMLPPPRWTVGGRPAWAWHDVQRWLKLTKRA